MTQVSHSLTTTSSLALGNIIPRGSQQHVWRGAFCKSLLAGVMTLGAVGFGAIGAAQPAPTLASPTAPSSESALEQTPSSQTTPYFDSTGTFLAGRSGVPITHRQVHSIWLDRETIVSAGSEAGLAQVFDRFKAAGINTVFVETVNAGYPIYDSDVAPAQNPLIRGWDPLQAAINLGKAHNMEVHAWVWLFAAGNQAHNRLVGQPTGYPGPILSARPEWAGFDNKGNLIIPGQTKPFLDPANPEVRQYLLSLLSEIAGRYDIDGIQFDYVRYPFQDPSANRLFGYGNAARRQFHQLTGVDPITLSPKNGGDAGKAHLWNQWVSFRIQQISTFVAEASHRLRQQKPHLTISAAVFADPTQKRRHGIQQDWEDWADQGLVDWIVLMSYASNTQRLDELIRPWLVESSYPRTQVIPGIRLLNLSPAAAAAQLRHIQSLPANGYALFAADNLNSEVQNMLAWVQRGVDIVQEEEEAISSSRNLSSQSKQN
ncbi:MAG: family 10 glycosylhydrolase [Cyanobacteria bacterium P01_D01_bin.105]